MSPEEPMSGDCIIEAGTVLCGVLPDGTMSMRHDVGIRVAGGMIAQIGPLAAVAYGNDHLARFGSPDMIAMPGLVNSHHHFGITPLMQGVPFAPLELWLPQFRAMRQIDVRLDVEQPQHSVEQIAVLGCSKDADVGPRFRAERLDHGRHLDRFGPGADRAQYARPAHSRFRNTGAPQSGDTT